MILIYIIGPYVAVNQHREGFISIADIGTCSLNDMMALLSVETESIVVIF